MGETNAKTNPDCRSGKCLPPIIKRSVGKVIVHENYENVDGIPRNDIALIRVTESIPLFSEEPSISSIIPICLPWKDNDPGRNLREGDSLRFSGWGRTTRKNSENAQKKLLKYNINQNHLKWVGLPYLSNDNEKCSKLNVTNSMICAGGERGE